MTLFDPQHHTGHLIRRWNYPPEYRLPTRMPAKVLHAIRAIEADTGITSPVPALARELATRCRDFQRLEAKYAASQNSGDPAHTYWPEAYFGIIETADWLCFEASGPVFGWARDIFASEMGRFNRGLPTDEGLSPEFKELLTFLEDRLARVARTAHNNAVLFEDRRSVERMPDFHSDMHHAAEKALKNLEEAFEYAREAYMITPADRGLKMRIVEIEYGPPLMIRLHAKATMHLHSVHNIVDLRDLRVLQHDRATRMPPRRLDHKYWSWMYRNEPSDR